MGSEMCIRDSNKIVSVQVDGIPCDEEMDDISPTVDSLKSSDSTDKLSLS